MESSDPIFKCYNCDEELVFDVKIGRRDMCPSCYAYLHCCYNCKYWDKNVHNQCTENQGEFIRDRAEGNFCLYFTFKPVPGTEGITEEETAKQKIEAMFGGSKVESSPKTADDAKARLDKLFSK